MEGLHHENRQEMTVRSTVDMSLLHVDVLTFHTNKTSQQ